MEPLWSPAVATGSNRWQMGGRPERLRQAQTIAVGCDRLPKLFHGKEGVDGSSPSEGLKYLQIRYFCCLSDASQEITMEGVSGDAICRYFCLRPAWF